MWRRAPRADQCRDALTRPPPGGPVAPAHRRPAKSRLQKAASHSDAGFGRPHTNAPNLLDNSALPRPVANAAPRLTAFALTSRTARRRRAARAIADRPTVSPLGSGATYGYRPDSAPESLPHYG